MLGNATWLAPLSLSVGNDVDPFLCPADRTCATSKLGNDSTGTFSKADEASSFAEMNGPLFIALARRITSDLTLQLGADRRG